MQVFSHTVQYIPDYLKRCVFQLYYNSTCERGESVFEEFLNLPPSLLKVRWEQQARSVAAPYVKKLRERGFTSVLSLRVCPFDELGIPPKIARQVKLLMKAIANSEANLRPSTVAALGTSSPSERLLTPMRVKEREGFREHRPSTSGFVDEGPHPYSLKDSKYHIFSNSVTSVPSLIYYLLFLM